MGGRSSRADAANSYGEECVFVVVSVMAGLVPAIHVFFYAVNKTWMPGFARITNAHCFGNFAFNA